MAIIMWASHPHIQYPSPGPKPDEETERNAEPGWNPGLFSGFSGLFSAWYVFPPIDDLRKSRGLHSVSAYRYGLYIQVHACGCSAE